MYKFFCSFLDTNHESIISLLNSLLECNRESISILFIKIEIKFMYILLFFERNIELEFHWCFYFFPFVDAWLYTTHT